jgi:hypothetical protein
MPAMRRTKSCLRIGIICLGCSCDSLTGAQETPPASMPSSSPDSNPILRHRPAEVKTTPKPGVEVKVNLTVKEGTALQVALDQEVRVQKVGQTIHGRIVAPVYAFDKVVVPVGTEVTGKISGIGDVSPGARTLAALDANLSPARKIDVEFTELDLAGGTRIPMQTSVVAGSGQVIKFVTAGERKETKGIKNTVTEKERQAKEEAQREWDSAMQQVKTPGKLHRIERMAAAQLPVHPQYIEAGTVYFAELKNPLEFGDESLARESVTTLQTEIPQGSLVHARLMSPLSSATTQKGTQVKAVLSQPLLDDGHLILPQGTLLNGTVVQVRPARYWQRNGQIRFAFHDVVMPDGVEEKIEAMVQGVQAGAADNMSLDAEGGAEPQTSKTRYLWTAVSVALAMTAQHDDTLNRVAGGAGGFKVVGMVIGATVHSQPLALAMGAFGASRSIYAHFIARGRDVAFAKHTAIEISVGTRKAVTGTPTAGSPTSAPKEQ